MSITKEEVLQKLQSIFDQLFLEEVVVTPELSAHDVEEWDSLLHISLVVSIEEAFNIRFRVGEVEATHNVGEFADLIMERVNQASYV
jgi:acyl carrier protein